MGELRANTCCRRGEPRRAAAEQVDVTYRAAESVVGPRSEPPMAGERVVVGRERSQVLLVYSRRPPARSPAAAVCRSAGRTDRLSRPMYRRLGRTFACGSFCWLGWSRVVGLGTPPGRVFTTMSDAHHPEGYATSTLAQMCAKNPGHKGRACSAWAMVLTRSSGSAMATISSAGPMRTSL
jgi:hypothetical protein